MRNEETNRTKNTMDTMNEPGGEIDKTLRAFEGIERALPPPFFSTRTQARLERRLAQKTSAVWLFRPAYALASLGLLLTLNMSAVLYFQQHLNQHEEQQFVEGVVNDWGNEASQLDW